MMMIQGNVATAVAGVPAGTSFFPADRCSWRQAASGDGSGYRIMFARFYPGIGDNDAIILQNPVLGFIGKSGRFVAITDAT